MVIPDCVRKTPYFVILGMQKGFFGHTNDLYQIIVKITREKIWYTYLIWIFIYSIISTFY